ncbi:MAG TPA: Xaa-Pro peptidase family protein [Methylomirabilota bacterium]|nr:Xaa-Pro peptidase family protein [Methylomirabilota bacterium]
MYPHQLERLTAVLAAHRLDALVGTTPANVAYLTEWRSVSRIVYPETPVLAVFAPSGTALVIPAIDTPAVAEGQVAIDHIVPFGRFVFAYAARADEIGRQVRGWMARAVPSPDAALTAALDALGVRRGTIGLDEGGITPSTAREVTTALAGRRVVGGGDALLAARQVKGPWEIEALERALIVAEEALNAVIQMLAPGVTERAAVELFETEVRKREATPCCPLITFGPRTALPAAATSDRVLRTGNLIRLDVGCVWRGYHADVTRTAVMGAPDPRQEKVFDAVLIGLEAGIDAARPGATAGAIFSATVTAARGAGLPDYDRHHVGYGIGLDPRERPMLESGSTTPLETGMVLRLETPYYEHGWGGAQVKETVLVTTSGTRAMNRSHRGLVVLD